MSDGPWPLEPSPEAFRAAALTIVDRLASFLGELPDLPTRVPEGDLTQLRRPFSEQGTSLTASLRTLFEEVAPPGYQPAGPGYLAYIPGGGIVSSGLATFIAAITNKYVGIWAASPGFVQLELNVVRWFCELVGIDPDEGGGFLTTGGSMANFSAVVAARHDRLPPHFLDGVLYASDQAHHCVAKAALLAGFPRQNVRTVPTDSDFRLDLAALRSMLKADTDAGRTPFMVVASAGTTNTGAVDPLDAVADIAERWGLWYHVDAAYGGFFMLTERGRSAMVGIERADSVALDPHKGLFVPYGTGGLVVRDRRTLAASHSVDADYLTDLVDAGDRRVDFSALSPELTRDNRGVRVWLPLQLHGIGAFRRALDEKLDLARMAFEGLRRIPQLKMLAAPQLSVCAWRYVPSRGDWTDAEIDAFNRDLIDWVTERGRVMISGTVLNEVFACRVAVLCVRTHQDRIAAALEDIAGAVEALEARA